MKEKTANPESHIQTKYSLGNRKIKTATDEGKLRESVPSRPILKERL